MAKKSMATPKPKAKSNNGSAKKSTPKVAQKLTPSQPNASILSFFKKEDIEQELFVQGRRGLSDQTEDSQSWDESRAESKRRRLSGEFQSTVSTDQLGQGDCTPPPTDTQAKRRPGPFVDVSDSEEEEDEEQEEFGKVKQEDPEDNQDEELYQTYDEQQLDRLDGLNTKEENDEQDQDPVSTGDFEEFEGIEDFDDDQGEETEEQRWSQEQTLLALENGMDKYEPEKVSACPLCSTSLSGLSDGEASAHVNRCLDGSEPSTAVLSEENLESLIQPDDSKPLVKRPAKPGQNDPLLNTSALPKHKSAFSKLMSNNAEDSAWAAAAASEHASRGKPSYQRTCPFYKIMPNMNITMDAFRYGAVEGCSAYFLSHFHSDHYGGLTSTWSHGPIYCSRVTATLVVQQLKVDQRWVKPLDFEVESVVPGTNGVKATLIDANHCPGSAIVLFEQPKGHNRSFRILHTGDFRASRKHLEHPKIKGQKIDICYLDTTYLNPKYAFPSQDLVIKACADLCVQLNKQNCPPVLQTLASKMTSFLSGASTNANPTDISKLLVVVGTYSIGKERVCLAIAKALKTKIFAFPNKVRLLNALDDPDLKSLLTTNPKEAQVHMTSLFEIRADTLADYLASHKDTFSHVVGFRPTGWTYRPPATRLSNPPVQDILSGPSWQTGYTVKDLAPQRGSTKTSSCYGVCYSEHSSFRELCSFICGLEISRVIPTVNVGSQKSRETMKFWVTKWEDHRKRSGLFKGNF